MTSYCYGMLLLLFLSIVTVYGEDENETNVFDEKSEFNGTRWAVLVAGSKGYQNYRHQADVCHAYQILKKGGLKDGNIIVFMYDDIAHNQENPKQGIIVNRPKGQDVYKGVPKDYTGKNVSANNFFAVLLGNKTALTGGSGKVVQSGPNDHIFIFYVDHGTSGVIEIPGQDGSIYAKDLVDVLKKKHEAKSYKTMVFYLEACEAGSMFEGLLTEDMNIWALTASNATENSYGYYCDENEYNVCLGDLFSISWLEDSESHDMRKESLAKQFEVVKRRTGNFSEETSSHVMHYGSMKPQNEFLVDYIGENSANNNHTLDNYHRFASPPSYGKAIDQRDADLLHFRQKFRNAPDGSQKKIDAQKNLQNEISQRKNIDSSITRITASLNDLNIWTSNRPAGLPLVDDWDCFKTLVTEFKNDCSSSSSYGIKYYRVFANVCNDPKRQINRVEKVVSVIREACSTF